MKPKLIVNKTDVKDINLCYESGNGSCLMVITPSTIRGLLFIFFGLISVLIMFGNLLVITSIIYFKQLHTPTNYLILSLAVADLLVGALVLPLSIILSIKACWYFGDLLCKLRFCLDVSLSTASIIHLCFISIDRYYAVCQPLRYRIKITVHLAGIMILVGWSVSVSVGFSILIQGLNLGNCDGRCFLFDVSNSNIMGCVLSFYLPATIMLSIYLKIFLVAQRQARSIQNTTCKGVKSGASVSKMERKATKTLAVVMGIFLICWTPFFLCTTFQSSSNFSISIPVIEVFVWLGWSNSMLNPFVYAFFYSWFRVAFRMIISGKIFQGDFANSKLI